MTEETRLLQSSKTGDTAAFEKIVNRYQSMVCAITFSGTGRVDTSEDLAQETFLRAWKNLGQLKDLAGFRAWLCTIARNVLHNHYRQKKTVSLDQSDPDSFSSGSENPSETLIRQEELVMLEQAIMQIPAEYREPLVMFYRQHQSTRDVAESLGLNESTVRTRLHRARQMLREEIAARLERTLQQTAPDKTFTKAVMAAVGAGLAASAAGTASAAVSVTGAAGTAGSSGVAAVMSTVTAKIITAAAVAAFTVGGVFTYKYLPQLRPEPQPDEMAIVSVEQEPMQVAAMGSAPPEQQEMTVDQVEVVAESAASDSPVENTANVEITAMSSDTDLAHTSNIDEKTGRLIKVYVTDKDTGKPIEKATVYVDARESVWTDKNGCCELWWDRNDKEYGKRMSVWARKDGYVRMSYSVRTENSPGEDPIDIHYAMEKGTIVGGVVQNAEGNTMAGIDLTVRVNDDEHMEKPENHVKHGVITDEKGRWQIDCVPAQLEKVNLRTKHADYFDQSVWLESPEDIRLLRNKEYVLVVDEGYSISGAVKDETGNPVKGARVQLGDYYFAQDRQHRTHTDDNGQFDFKQLRIGNSGSHYEFVEGQGNVLVRRPFDYIAVTADGFSPQTMTIYFKEKHVDLDFMMSQGDPIYGQVVDPNGIPVVGAIVRADNWGRNSYDHVCTIDWNTKTDIEGRFVWEHAPAFEIQVLITQDGYMDLRTEKVKPSETEYEFVLNPQLRVFGQVVDAVTQKPITVFTYRRYEGRYISTPQTIKDNEGRFKTAFDDQSEKFTISFEADGYKPTRSREISLIEQDVELLIEMQPDSGINGIVVKTDGTPVVGARVLVPGSLLTVDNLKYESNWLRDIPNAKTDDRGHFHLKAVSGEEYCILILEESGYLLISSENIPVDRRFVLQPYGRIEGTWYKGSRPVANERIRIDYPCYQYVDKGNGVTALGPAFNFNTQTDENGKYVFDKLIPGTARILIDPYREVEIEAGQTHEIHIGGNGLTVQGQILNSDGEPLNEDVGKCFLEIQRIYDSLPIPAEEWPLPEGADAMTYVELLTWFTEFGQSDEDRQWLASVQQKYGDLTGSHSFEVDHNGRFEVPNVTPGTYMLTASVQPWENTDFPRRPDYNTVIAQASATFIVPEFHTVADMNIPVDLGTLQCRPSPLAIGQMAPDFDILRLKSAGRIRLSDYRGKTVLVNFTNPALKEAEPEKADMLERTCQLAEGKAEIINVAMELLPWDYMRQKMIPECTLPGLYGVATAHNSKIDADYKTRHSVPLPYSVMIDADGMILWIGPTSEELLEIIESLIR